jgi:hypothetical protein
MRYSFALAALILFGAFQTHLGARDLPGDFFPDGTFNQFATEKWYGPYLYALDEPSLYRLSKKPSVCVYRITCFPPFAAYFALTLYVQPDGSGRLELRKKAQITTTVDGGGYAPGPTIRRATFLISQGAVRRFQQSLESIHFWRLNTSRSELMLDANTFLYEAACGGRYHVVEVTDPGFPSLLPPARILLHMAGEMPN